MELVPDGGAVSDQFRDIPEKPSVKGAEIKTSTGIKLGTINKYSSPSFVGLVDPIVLVEPSIDDDLVAKIPLGRATAPTGLAVGDKVLIEDIDATLTLSTRTVKGEVSSIDLTGSSNYFGGALNVAAYEVTFDRNLQQDSHGTRVVLDTGTTPKPLLGMLIFTSNAGGKCNALVYPAHLMP